MATDRVRTARRSAVRTIAFQAATLSTWSTPVVQSLLLPAHARTSSVPPIDPITCVREDVPGKWLLELYGVAASTSEITFFSDGTADHLFINAWQFSGQEFLMVQGVTWMLSGAFTECDVLSGTYIHMFVNPVLGNIILRRGDWRASKIP